MIILIENDDRKTLKFHLHSSIPARLAELNQDLLETAEEAVLSSLVFLIGQKYVGLAEEVNYALKSQERCVISIPDLSRFQIPTEYEIQLAESFGDKHHPGQPEDGLQLLVNVPISAYDSLFIHGLITLVNI